MLQVNNNKLKGYAVVYNATTAGAVPIGGVMLRERIDTGAFTDSLGKNIPFTFHHKDFAEYGDTKSGTLRLNEDSKGIAFELDLPPYANVLKEQIASGAIRGMSFGFTARAITVDKDNIRHIVKADLLHISPVYSPAYPQTSIELVQRNMLSVKRKQLLLREKMS